MLITFGTISMHEPQDETYCILASTFYDFFIYNLFERVLLNNTSARDSVCIWHCKQLSTYGIMSEI